MAEVFTEKTWENEPSHKTPIDASGLNDLEKRIKTGYKSEYEIAASDAPDRIKSLANAVCDGTADQVEINAALAAGKRVILSEGTFNLTASVEGFQDGSYLRGMGQATILEHASHLTGEGMVNAVGTAEAPLDGIEIHDLVGHGIGDTHGGSPVDHFIRLSRVKNSCVSGIRGRDVNFSVVALINSILCDVTKIRGLTGVEGEHGGWYLVSANNQGFAGDAEYAAQYGGHHISHLFSGLPEHGLSFTWIDWCTASQINSSNNYTDLLCDVQGAQHNQFENLSVAKGGGLLNLVSWKVGETTRLAEGNSLRGGKTHKNSEGEAKELASIWVRGAPGTTISDVEIDNTGQTAGNAILVDSESDRFVAENVRIKKAFKSGINLATGADECEIRGGRFEECGEYGLSISGQSTRIFGPLCKSNTLSGLIIAGKYTSVLGGQYISNGGDGIRVSQDEGKVRATECRGNAGYGINVNTAAADNNIIADNDLKGNTAGALSDSGTGTIAYDNRES